MKNHGLIEVEGEIAAAESVANDARIRGPGDYADDPVGYVRNILGFKFLWDEQENILRSLREPPYRTLVKAGHSVGKTMLAAAAVNWWYDSFNPGVVISTAPDHRSVCDLLWKEIRVQRQRAGLGDLLPSAPEMRSGPAHYAKGFTASTGDSFQGRHDERMLFVFDEAIGVDPVFWDTTSTMFKPELGHAWLAIFNPTSTASQAFIEDHAIDRHGNPKWKRFQLDCLEHPNIVGRKEGDKPIIPAAVSWAQVDSWVQQWCQRIPTEEKTPQDFEWPKDSGVYWRPGPSFLARCRGIWPSGGAWTVWDELVWLESIARGYWPANRHVLPEIGVDCASGGEDFTSMHVRWGDESYYHESSNAWKQPDIVSRIKMQTAEWARRATAAQESGVQPFTEFEIPVKIDDDGFGRAISQGLQADGYNVIQIGAGTKSITGQYPNKRSELWFQTADRARMGRVGLARLDKAVHERLRTQLLTVTYGLNSAGMRVVEPKDVTRERIGRSPDDADALNLAYLEGYDIGTAKYVEDKSPRVDPWAGGKGRRRIFGV